jgi:hypothetical protein
MSHVLEDKAVEAIIQGKKNLFFQFVGGLARAHPSDEFSSQHPSKPKATTASNPFLIVYLSDQKKGCLQNQFFFFHINSPRI